jgi:hypothetical protein
MGLLVISFIILVLIFYMQCYFKHSIDFSLIQTTLQDFNPNMLYAKQPVYVYDKVVNPGDLLHTLFKYQYVTHELSLSNNRYLKQNLSRFLIIYNDSIENAIISVYHPSVSREISFYYSRLTRKNYKVCKDPLESKDAYKVDIIIKPHNFIILPMDWVYKTSLDNILEIHLFDCFTYTSSFLR